MSSALTKVSRGGWTRLYMPSTYSSSDPVASAACPCSMKSSPQSKRVFKSSRAESSCSPLHRTCEELKNYDSPFSSKIKFKLFSPFCSLLEVANLLCKLDTRRRTNTYKSNCPPTITADCGTGFASTPIFVSTYLASSSLCLSCLDLK